MDKFKLKILDIYIIKKFLGTFFFAELLIISIAVVFDFSEKIDNFLENEAPLSIILSDYYLNFIPYFAVLFSSLFVFIAVVFFTSKMAYNTEIIAILSSGVSFRRLLYPYFISSFIIAIFTYYLTNNVIPQATENRLDFEEEYYHSNPIKFKERNVHKQIEPGVYVYLESFRTINNIGRSFSMEKFDGNRLKSKLLSDYIRWDSSDDTWRIRNYYIRKFEQDTESIETGRLMDTIINMKPSEFKVRENIIETMTTNELNVFLEEQRMQGNSNIEPILIERYKRVSMPFSTFILTLIGVSLSSRKIRGGTGMHIGLGLLVAFSYILFMEFSAQFAIGGTISPLLAVWIPNIIYAFVGVVLYKKAAR